MADILTLEDARSALGWKPGQNPDRDDLLENLYIPTTTQIVESVRGRMIDWVESWTTVAASPIATPWTLGTVASVTVNGGTITGYTYTSGVLTITDPAYTAGASVCIVMAGLPTPASVMLAARIIVAHLWNADNQQRSGGSTLRGDDTVVTPLGFAIPRRAYDLLVPVGSFA